MLFTRFAKTGLAAILVTIPFLSTPGTSSAQPEPPPWAGLGATEAPPGSPLAACVGAAKSKRPVAWTCLGGQLTERVMRNGQPEDIVTDVVAWEIVDTTNEARLAVDDYDSWCESGTVCGRRISDYVAEVKGNAAYGDQNGAIGSFDQVVRQSFNGGNPRWRELLDYDSGPAVNGFGFHTRCRKHVSLGSDGVCGDNPYDPSTISSISTRAWHPSSTGYTVNSQVLSGSSSKYHDENYGSFTAAGKTLTWSTGTIHTGRWNGCGSCKYYQVPWSSDPNVVR